MTWLLRAMEVFIHLDRFLGALITRFGSETYALLFLVVFAETGLVVTPFLPGDSLLFAAGAFAATGVLNVTVLFLMLTVAAVLGDSVNYTIGKRLGAWLIAKADGGLVRRSHLERTERFFQKHGAKAIVVARFVPIVRTFAPFVAGLGRMEYSRFLSYNVFGAVTWVGLFVFGGYLFGNLPVVRNNFSYVILGIVAISLLPACVAFLRARLLTKR